MTIKWMTDEQMGEVQTDGLFTRAASYGASMVNAYFFDQLIREDPQAFEGDLLQIIRNENSIISALEALHFFELFSVEEWLNSPHLGRKLLGMLYLRRHNRQLPSQDDPETVTRLTKLIDKALSDAQGTSHNIALEPKNLIADGQQGWVTDSGIFYRKGTSLATMDNCKLYQEAIDAGAQDRNNAQLNGAINDQQFITNMMSQGLFFSFFPPLDWLADARKEGRMLPALMLLLQFPQRVDESTKTRLNELQPQVSPVTAQLIAQVLELIERTRSREEAVKQLLLTSLKAINSSNFKKFWLDSNESLLVSGTTGLLVGLDEIAEFYASYGADSAKKPFCLDDADVTVDLQKGTARLTVSTVEGGSQLVCHFKRSEQPSCLELARGHTSDWRVGQWLISAWYEMKIMSPERSL